MAWLVRVWEQRTAVALLLLTVVGTVAVVGPTEASGPRPEATTLATPDARHLHLPAGAFTAAAGTSLDRDHETGCVAASSPDWVEAPLALPDGATLAGFEAFYRDRDTGDLTVELVAHDTAATARHAAPRRTVVHRARTPENAPGYDVLTSVAPVTPEAAVVDNHDHAYRVQVAMDGGQELCGVLVHWRPPLADDLVFHAVTPCAVLDTRPGRGGQEQRLLGDELITFDTIRGDYSSQGGVPRSCGIPAARSASDPGGTVAVMVNLVALDATSSGNLRAWDPDVAEPVGGVLVFEPTGNTNSILPLAVQDAGPGRGLGGDVQLRNNGSGEVHVRAVVVGYFTAATSG